MNDMHTTDGFSLDLARKSRQRAVDLLARERGSSVSMHADLRAIAAEEGLESDVYSIVQFLILGVTKHRNTIDFILGRVLKQGHKRIDLRTWNALRLEVYETRWLGVPPEKLGACYPSNLLKMKDLVDKATRFDLESAIGNLTHVEQTSILYSHPTFMVKTLFESMPESEALRLMESNNGPREYYLRANLLKTTVDGVLSQLDALGVSVQQDADMPGLFRVVDGVSTIVLSDLFRNGLVLLQDKASVFVAKVLQPKPGDTVWDTCAAPGMKTQYLWESMNGEGRLVATDASLMRVRGAANRAHLLGCEGVQWVQGDASRNPIRGADKILIDAPCTSSGILRSHPMFKWRLNKKTLFDIMSVQNKILDGVMRACSNRPGTEIVYATCSLLPHEGESQIDSMLSRYKVELLEIGGVGSPGYPGFECSSKARRFFPQTHGTSGFFVCRFRTE